MIKASLPLLMISLAGILCANVPPSLSQETKKSGSLKFTIRDAESGALLPGKLVFLQNDTIVDLGIASTNEIASRENTVYTLTGRGTIQIPQGSYEVWAGRGLEYSADIHQIEVQAGAESSVDARIFREVNTAGYVGGDMHLHTYTYSGHGDSQVDERLISCIGEGLEWAVATDHNHVTDYAPAAKELRANDKMLTTVGNEISTPIGHFNAYPLPSGSKPTDHTLKDANALFKLIRDANREVVIQINHPRWPGGDYFSLLGLDSHFGLSDNPSWSWNFDAFELLNENRGLGWIPEPGSPISVLDDWYNMLNSGHRFTAVGNSDSHTVLSILAGVPRNYIASSSDDPATLDEDELVASIKKQNVSVNRGLYVEFSTADGGQIGELRKPGPYGVSFKIRVQAPSWVACDSIFLIANGDTVAAFAAQSSENVLRFDQTITVMPQHDTWYIAVASADESMAPLVHDAPVPITPLGFTNPIWIDADGDGRFTSLLERAGRFVEQSTQSSTELTQAFAENQTLRKSAISYLAQNDLPGKTRHFSQLLANATLDERLFIYKEMAKLKPADAGLNLLDSRLDESEAALEKAMILAALVQLGKKDLWADLLIAAQKAGSHRYLDTALRKMTMGTFFRNWQIAGPFHYLAAHGLDSVFTVERAELRSEAISDSIEWRTPVAMADGIVRLSEIYGSLRKAVAYARMEFSSTESGKMLFLTGSDDGVAIWLNGEEIHRNDSHRGVVPGDDIVFGEVRKGKNHMLLKIENGGGNWGFCIEPVDPYQWLTF